MEKHSLTDIAEIITGANVGRRTASARVPFIQIKDFDPAKRALVAGAKPGVRRAVAAQPGDVLLAARGGQVVVAGHGAGTGLVGAYPTLDVYLIRPDAKQLDAAFLAAWLTLDPVRHALQASTRGALIPRIPVATLRALPIPLPVLARQRSLGALLQLARREADLLERLTMQTRYLRERQLAVAFASLEPHAT